MKANLKDAPQIIKLGDEMIVAKKRFEAVLNTQALLLKDTCSDVSITVHVHSTSKLYDFNHCEITLSKENALSIIQDEIGRQLNKYKEALETLLDAEQLSQKDGRQIL